MPRDIRTVVPETFTREVTRSRRPVMVWFEPLKTPSPRAFHATLADFAKQHVNFVKCVRVDVRGKSDELLQWFSIGGPPNRFPALLLFSRGVTVERACGATKAKKLLRGIEEAIQLARRTYDLLSRAEPALKRSRQRGKQRA